MKTTIHINDLMSCGCRNSIHQGLGLLPGVYGVRVDPDRLEVTIDHTDETSSSDICCRLRQMGYTPADGSDNITDNNP